MSFLLGQFRIFLAAVQLLVLLTFPCIVYAQDDFLMGAGPRGEQNEDGSDTVSYGPSDEYVSPTLANLSKVYWVLAINDLNDSDAIDNYLKINECEIYAQYHKDDFEMAALREAIRESIIRNLASFSTTFEVVVPIGLENFDTGTEKFRISPDSQFNGSKRILFAGGKSKINNCTSRQASVPGYPSNFVLQLSLPFVLRDIPVEPDMADLYMKANEQARLDGELFDADLLRLSSYKRIAYLRLKVKMLQYKEMILSGMPGPKYVPSIFAEVHGYEVYGNKELSMLLYSDAVKDKKIIRKRKVAAGKSQIEEQIPDDESKPIVSPSDVDAIKRKETEAFKERQ